MCAYCVYFRCLWGRLRPPPDMRLRALTSEHVAFAHTFNTRLSPPAHTTHEQATAIAETSAEIINEENKARYEAMATQCKLLVSEVAASQEATETANAGQRLLLVAQQAIGEHLLELVQVRWDVQHY